MCSMAVGAAAACVVGADVGDAEGEGVSALADGDTDVASALLGEGAALDVDADSDSVGVGDADGEGLLEVVGDAESVGDGLGAAVGSPPPPVRPQPASRTSTAGAARTDRMRRMDPPSVGRCPGADDRGPLPAARKPDLYWTAGGGGGARGSRGSIAVPRAASLSSQGGEEAVDGPGFRETVRRAPQRKSRRVLVPVAASGGNRLDMAGGPDMARMEDKVAIITGAASGMGLSGA